MPTWPAATASTVFRPHRGETVRQWVFDLLGLISPYIVCVLSASPVLTTHVGNATSSDPILKDPILLDSLPEAPNSPPSPLYEFRSTPKHAYTPFRPSTPRRSPTPSDAGSPCATPAWARPLHLIDDEVSIFKNSHGDRAREHPLCLHCFRLHGEFRKMVKRRCRVCGQNDVLEGHYWEADPEPYWR